MVTHTSPEAAHPAHMTTPHPEKLTYFRRPSYLLLTTAGTIIVAEILIMTVIRYLPPMGFLPEALLDGIMLSFIVFPSLYFFFFKYLNEQISQNKKLENDLRTALETATVTNRTMSRLLRTVAHEFRTPLGLLTGSTDILDRYWDRLTPEKRLEQNRHIRSAARQMSDLVNSVVAFNQLGTDTPNYAPRQIDLADACRTIAHEVETVWSSGQSFQLSIHPEGVTAILDETLFRRVLENLLTNAFRYTPPDGTIDLTVSKTGDALDIRIRDNGIGVPAEDQSMIFDAFYRSGNVEGRRGLGLGLSIVQEALQRMGGSITINSAVGTGTTMQVVIPANSR